MPNDTTAQLNNYTLTKLIRTGISPLSAMIGVSSYYGQMIGNPILGSINALLFSKKLGIDIWNLNQIPSSKTKLLNSSKKIILGLGTIGLVNYSKFMPNIEPVEPITTTTETPPWLSTATLLVTNNIINEQSLIDWDTYISLNVYGIANLMAGITELIPNRFEAIRKIANMATGGALIGTGVAMGINNGFDNAYAGTTIVSGASEIIHNLLPMQTNIDTEMQETTFTNETARLINNDNLSNYGSDFHEVQLQADNTSLNWDYNHMSL